MKILSLQIERDLHEQGLCGTLDYELVDGQEGALLWTLSGSAQKIEVAFVQGTADDWDYQAQRHSRYLSDQLILAVARQRGLAALSTPKSEIFSFQG